VFPEIEDKVPVPIGPVKNTTRRVSLARSKYASMSLIFDSIISDGSLPIGITEYDLTYFLQKKYISRLSANPKLYALTELGSFVYESYKNYGGSTISHRVGDFLKANPGYYSRNELSKQLRVSTMGVYYAIENLKSRDLIDFKFKNINSGSKKAMLVSWKEAKQ
jgi:hypothetical protein